MKLWTMIDKYEYRCAIHDFIIVETCCVIIYNHIWEHQKNDIK